jgi:hypothetical protein
MNMHAYLQPSMPAHAAARAADGLVGGLQAEMKAECPVEFGDERRGQMAN